MSIELNGAPKVRMRNLSEQVYKNLKMDILRKNITPGARLVEQELCQKYFVSRTPVREAIQMLKAEGLIEIEAKQHIRIIEMTHDDEVHITQVRVVLERVSLMEIFESFNPDDYACLMEIHGRCAAATERNDLPNLFETDSRFHLELARRSGNPFLYKALNEIDAKVQLLRSIEYYNRDKILAVVNMHTVILNQLRDRNLEGALDTMRRHILAATDMKNPS